MKRQTMTGTRYYAGESDALVRQSRAYLRLIDDPETQQDRRQAITAVVADNFRTLDEYLSRGEPLPAQWMNGRDSVDLTGSEDGAEGSRPGRPESVPEGEGES